MSPTSTSTSGPSRAHASPTTRALVDLLPAATSGTTAKPKSTDRVVAYEARRGPLLFERWGFKVIDQREVTKYRDLDPRQIYLYTILKDLTRQPQRLPQRQSAGRTRTGGRPDFAVAARAPVRYCSCTFRRRAFLRGL